MNDLLPIGSVVALNQYQETLLIVGYKAQKEQGQEEYDYVGCLMPLGYTSEKEYILFNREDIRNILYVGYQSNKMKEVKRIINFQEKNTPINILLPIGSVVKLKNSYVQIFIMGYISESGNNFYDYLGCKFPMGMRIKKRYYFNSEDIEKIYFVGPQNKDSIAYRNVIKEELFKLKEGYPEALAAMEIRDKYLDEGWKEAFEDLVEYSDKLKKEKEEEQETPIVQGFEIEELHPFEENKNE